MIKVDRSIIFWYGMASNGKNMYPAVTIATRINADGTVNRGIAVLSANDNPSKKAGRILALKRLEVAETRQMNCMPINWNTKKFEKVGYKHVNDVPHWGYKAQYHVPIHDHEDRVFNNPNPRSSRKN